MKTSLLFAALLILPVALTVEAAPAGLMRHPFLNAWRHRALEKFDADKDGQLSQAERDAAKTAVKEKITSRRAERFQRLDADSDGQISRAEWDAAPGKRQARTGVLRERILEKFDADKDGQLSPSERIQARTAIREWFMK